MGVRDVFNKENTNMIIRIIERLGALGSIVFLFFIVGYTIFPMKSVDVSDIQVLEEELRIGDVIPMSITSCVFYTGQADVAYRIENGIVVTVADFSVQVEPTCRTTQTATLRVPEGIVPGTHRLRLDAVYHVNPYREVVKTFYSNEFTVIE